MAISTVGIWRNLEVRRKTGHDKKKGTNWLNKLCKRIPVSEWPQGKRETELKVIGHGEWLNDCLNKCMSRRLIPDSDYSLMLAAVRSNCGGVEEVKVNI